MYFSSLEAFEAHFHNEAACSVYLYQQKWPRGFRCIRCNNSKAYTITTRRLPLFECSNCKHHHSLTTGTVMEGSRTSLRQWFTAIYLFTSAENSINASSLCLTIKVTYKTAWLMLHKLREALDHERNRSLLDGVVRVQGGAYGNPFNPYTEKDDQRHPLLAAGTIRESNDISNLRLSIMEPHHIQTSGHILHTAEQQFIEQNVSSNATEVRSVRYRLHMSRFRPLVQCITEFNNWASTSFHGLSRKYLQAYANEFSYRYNMLRHPHSWLSCLFDLCTHVQSRSSGRSLSDKYRRPVAC